MTRPHIKHGRYKTREYRIWASMKSRCLNPNNRGYRYYGARGVKVCSQWLTSFENFYIDMGDCPEGYSIEREDSSGDYEPSNCKWIPTEDQWKNMRKRYVKHEADGRSMFVKEWAEELGVHHVTIRGRLKKGESMQEIYEYYLVKKLMKGV